MVGSRVVPRNVISSLAALEAAGDFLYQRKLQGLKDMGAVSDEKGI